MLSCGDETDPVPAEDDDEPNEDVVPDENGFVVLDEAGVALNYRNHCGGCHGQSFESFVERDWTYGNTIQEIRNSIEFGYSQNGMPAYSSVFSDSELDDLSNFILREIHGRTLADIQAENPDLSGTITSEDLNFRVETITEDIDGVPWGMVQLPDGGDFLVTVRSGTLLRITSEGTISEVSGLPNIVAEGQGGLLGITLHPDFESNSYIYFSYSSEDPTNSSASTTAVGRGRLQGNNLSNTEEIFVALPYTWSTGHYGSRLLFDENNYLYVTVGDRGERDEAQELSNGHGKVHRIMDDGQIPTDNPFYNTQDAIQSIYSYGIRNPQGFTLHPETGVLWEGEHGPQGGDEINTITSGNNYGWPAITYGIDYDGSIISEFTEMEGMEQPMHYWTPSIAPCGMTFASSSFYGDWENDLFVGSLKFEYVHRVIMNGDQVIGHEELLNDVGRVRDVHMGNDGYMYILVQEPGRLLRIVSEQ